MFYYIIDFINYNNNKKETVSEITDLFINQFSYLEILLTQLQCNELSCIDYTLIIRLLDSLTKNIDEITLNDNISELLNILFYQSLNILKEYKSFYSFQRKSMVRYSLNVINNIIKYISINNECIVNSSNIYNILFPYITDREVETQRTSLSIFIKIVRFDIIDLLDLSNTLIDLVFLIILDKTNSLIIKGKCVELISTILGVIRNNKLEKSKIHNKTFS